MDRCSALRGSSRAPQVARYLAGFGALRSDQLERLMGASRAGVHGMVANLRGFDLVTTTTVSGVKLHAILVYTPTRERVRSGRPTPLASLSKAVLDEFDAALAEVERLGARKTREE